MLYRILQFLMRRSLAAHYLQIKGNGLNTIPKTGPLMIAATHPNSFLDAIIIASLIDRPLHFLARSDVFRAKWADFLLRELNLIPIYRLQEGHENLSKNDDTFKECYSILDEGGAILIFVEGVSLIDMKLRPLKKGLARIVFGYADQNNFQKDCNIVPLGLNYDRPKDFRSKINVGVGQIQKISDFQENYELNKNTAYTILNEILYKELKEHTIQVEEKNYMVYKALAELDNCFDQNSLNRKILIAEHIESVSIESPKSLLELKECVQKAFKMLKDFDLNFRKLKVNAGVSKKDILLLILATPLAIISFLLNFIPFLIAKLIADRKVKLDEFYASVRLVSGTILWIIWSISISMLLYKYTPWALFFPIIHYWMARFYLRYYEKAKYVAAAYRLTKLKRKKERFEELQHLIKKIYRIRSTSGLAPNK